MDENKDTEIDDFSKHELLDRIFCAYQSFSDLVLNHPAAALIKAEIEAVDSALADLYQKAGKVRFPE